MGLEETLALTPRRERPELCARLAHLNQPTAPSPRPSPPPRGRGCPKGGRGGGSWAGGKHAQFPEFSRPLVLELFHGDSRRLLQGTSIFTTRLSERRALTWRSVDSRRFAQFADVPR